MTCILTAAARGLHLNTQSFSAALRGEPEALSPAQQPCISVFGDRSRVARGGLVRCNDLHSERLAGDHRLPYG